MNLRELMEAVRTDKHGRKWTAARVIAECGLARTHYYKIVKGEHMPTDETIEKLAAGFGRPVREVRAAVEQTLAEAGWELA